MSHPLDQQFNNPLDHIEKIQGLDSLNFLQIEDIKTPNNILTENKAEMITYPPELETALKNKCSKNCIYNKISLPLFFITLLILIATIYFTKISKN